METYILLSILFFTSAVVEPLLPYAYRRNLFFINGFVLLAVVGSRTCGTDYNLYRNIIKTKDLNDWPWLFDYLSKGIDFGLLVMLESVFTIVPVYYVFFKFTKRHINLLALFFFYDFFFNVLMQQSRFGLAMGLSMLSVFFVNNKKLSAIPIALASSIHQTSIITVVKYVIPNLFFKKYLYILAYAISLLLGTWLFDFLVNNVSFINLVYVQTKFSFYAERAERIDQVLSVFRTRELLYLLVFSISIYFTPARKNIPYLCNILFFSLCFYTLFVKFPEIAIRIPRFFHFAFYFLIVAILENRHIPKDIKVLIYILFLFYSLFNLYSWLNRIVIDNLDLNLIPYKSLLF